MYEIGTAEVIVETITGIKRESPQSRLSRRSQRQLPGVPIAVATFVFKPVEESCGPPQRMQGFRQTNRVTSTPLDV